MGGFGTVLAEGVAGAFAGAGQAAANQALLEQKDQMDKTREERLSKLRTGEYAANLQANIAAAPGMIAAQTPGLIDRARQEQSVKDASEAAKPRVLSPGSTMITPGTPGTPGATATDAAESGGTLDEGAGATPGTPDKTFTAPTRLTPEQRDYYEEGTLYRKAMADKATAEAAAINSGQRYTAGNHPRVTILDKDAGTLKDENTGAVGYMVPGKPAKEGSSSHLFGLIGKDTPAQPASSPFVQWYDSSGKPLHNGLDDLYQAKKGPAGTSAKPAAASPTTPGLPTVGDVVKGFKFKGGDPNDKANWEQE